MNAGDANLEKLIRWEVADEADGQEVLRQCGGVACAAASGPGLLSVMAESSRPMKRWR